MEPKNSRNRKRGIERHRVNDGVSAMITVITVITVMTVMTVMALITVMTVMMTMMTVMTMMVVSAQLLQHHFFSDRHNRHYRPTCWLNIVERHHHVVAGGRTGQQSEVLHPQCAPCSSMHRRVGGCGGRKM